MYYTTGPWPPGRWAHRLSTPLPTPPMPSFPPLPSSLPARLSGRLLLLLLVLSGCQRPAPPVVDLPVPEVTVARAMSREVTDFVEFTGNATAVETVMIKARVSGFITQVFFTDGQDVHEGDSLFAIDLSLIHI